jgi:potassium-transporting ATPase potassium-binding subunit
MRPAGTVQLLLWLILLLLAVRPFGGYLHRVFAGEATMLSMFLRPVEGGLYRLAGVRPDQEQDWYQYALSLLVFHVPGMLVLYLLLRLRDRLPLNPAGQTAVAPDLALNTAISFATNTSWQSFGGESALSHLSQMAGIAVQSLLLAAAGISVAVALTRGFARHEATTVGNFWVDMTRATLVRRIGIPNSERSFRLHSLHRQRTARALRADTPSAGAGYSFGWSLRAGRYPAANDLAA